jgi:hypothetical protein
VARPAPPHHLGGRVFPAFRRFTRPWQDRPWQRQQIIKFNAPAFTNAPFVLTLDPDVIAVKAITRELLLPGGRAILKPEARSVHPRWWKDSADLLGVAARFERPGINVTPALLSTAVLGEVQRQLEVVGARPWMAILLTSYFDWTEYAFYLLAADRAGLVARHHVRADDPAGPLPAGQSGPQHLGRKHRFAGKCRSPVRVRRSGLVRRRPEQRRPAGERDTGRGRAGLSCAQHRDSAAGSGRGSLTRR